jgi:hypothetical protein
MRTIKLKNIKTTCSISLLFLIVSFRSLAGVIDSATAVLAANNFYGQKTNQSFSVVNVYKISFNNHPSRYIVNYSNNGFAMVPATNAMTPYLAYSLDGQFDINNASPELAWLLNYYDLSIDSLITYNASDSTAAADWISLLNNTSNNNSNNNNTANRIISGSGFHLLQTLWDQTSPYNTFVSASNNGVSQCSIYGFGTQCPTGCVATASAQIMKYWNYAPGYGYDWCNMPVQLDVNSPPAHVNAVATLMADLGSALQMQYCESNSCASGSYIYQPSSGPTIPTAYTVFNNYGYGVTHILRDYSWSSNHLKTRFLDPIRNELNNNRPVLMAATNTGTGGGAHCFVCEGLDLSNTDIFYFNFGWSGSNNGFYNYASVNPSSDVFNTDQEVLLLGPNSTLSCSQGLDICPFNIFPPPSPLIGGIIYNSCAFTAVTNSNLTFIAYGEVKLSNGFRVEPGGNFRATTYPCPNNCPTILPADRQTNQQGTNLTASNSPKATKPDAVVTTIATKLGSSIKLGIFPNPTSGVVYLDLSAQNAGGLLVNISDLNGNQVLRNTFSANAGANSFKVDLSSLNQGVYFINITDENGVPIKNDKLVLMPQ